jgi:hypothetical protein
MESHDCELVAADGHVDTAAEQSTTFESAAVEPAANWRWQLRA